MLKRIPLLLCASFMLLVAQIGGQTVADKTEAQALARERLAADLQALDSAADKLEQPLARARAQAEIADAAWALDQAWAKSLLRAAYKLTLPAMDKQMGAVAQTLNTAPARLSALERAADNVRNRVLSIASRDKALADELLTEGAQELGSTEQQRQYAALATQALQAGDTAAASDYFSQALITDPTDLALPFNLLDLAARDRAAADRLTLRYIEQLRTNVAARKGQSLARSYFILGSLVFASSDPQSHISPPGPAVMKAYVSYIIESLSAQAQTDPSSLPSARTVLLSTWLPLQQYAPELTGAFMELERLSRRPGQEATLPRRNLVEEYQEKYDERLDKAINSGQADEFTISAVASRGNFNEARKLIERLDDETQRARLSELVNLKEALALSAKDDLAGAARLAERLRLAASLLQVYPTLINKCVAQQDQACAVGAVYQAMKQLKQSEAAPPPPQGIPASLLPTSQEFDPMLLNLGRLAKAVVPIDELLALQVLDELVVTANVSKVDTGQGRIGFEPDVFRLLAAKNQMRAQQSAQTLKDPLRQIVALANICQWQAAALFKGATVAPVPNKPVRKPSGAQARAPS